jgi:hypothetical protein
MCYGDIVSTQDIQIVSRQQGEVVSKKIRASPYEFTIATRAKWEMVVSDESIGVRAGEYRKIKVKEITLAPDLLAIPCAFSYHAVVSVLKVAPKEGICLVDQERNIRFAYILGQETGKVREGDLLGVLNIFPIMFTREATKPVLIR